MSSEAQLKEKLRKIEALFAGATIAGEKGAAGAAAERIRTQLKEVEARESPIEVQFSLPDPWSRRLFVALCRRYGLRVYRYPRMKQQTLILKAPKSFVDRVMWPEFQQINAALSEYLAEITDKVIREEVFREAGEAEEVQEVPKTGDELVASTRRRRRVSHCGYGGRSFVPPVFAGRGWRDSTSG